MQMDFRRRIELALLTKRAGFVHVASLQPKNDRFLSSKDQTMTDLTVGRTVFYSRL